MNFLVTFQNEKKTIYLLKSNSNTFNTKIKDVSKKFTELYKVILTAEIYLS